MNRLMKAVTSAAVAASLAACYHVTVDTGKPPSPQTIERPWAPSFIGGLVPPATVETASRCPNGVSRVETQLSFLNMLVGFLTFSIFTPMTIQVVCAASGSDDGAAPPSAVPIDRNGSLDQQRRDLTQAARLSAKTGEPVWVVFQ